MTSDTSERGLESLICTALTGRPCGPPPADAARERTSSYGVGWTRGDAKDYDREFCVDLAQLAAFLRATQPKVAASLDLGSGQPDAAAGSWPGCRGEISKRGTIDVIRQGDESRAAPDRSALWHAVAGEREGPGPVPAEPLQRHAAAALQPRRDPAFPGPGTVHQRPAGRHLRAEEQPHQADRG